MTTGGATSITPTSAILNGVVSVTQSVVDWTFQYGSSVPSPQNTGVAYASPGVTAVSKRISGLRPGATYHFRLLGVEQIDPDNNLAFVAGVDLTFTTPQYGQPTLVSRRFHVKRRFVSLPVACRGGRGAICHGTISLSATAKVGQGRRSVKCGSVTFSGSGGHTMALRARIGRTCATLLATSRKGSISATLEASSSTHQHALRQRITLFE